MPTKARMALVFLLAGCLTAGRAAGGKKSPDSRTADWSTDRPTEASITLTDATVQEQADAPPSDRPTLSRRHQVSEPGKTLGDTGEVLPENERWLQNSACIAGPAANAMPITAPDGCRACQRPGCGNGQALHSILRFFTYCPIQRGTCLGCCSACGYYHGAVPVYLYMRWPCRECGGGRPISPPCQYPRTCDRCKRPGCSFLGTHCPTP